jgi:single-stranded-DNA-specific exonuclease
MFNYPANLNELSAQIEKDKETAKLSKTWQITTPHVELIASLSSQLNLSPLMAHLMINRGYQTPKDVQDYLSPNPYQVASPSLLQDCTKAAQRIISAIKNNELIYIYGDYDVDGVTSTALIMNIFFDGLGLSEIQLQEKIKFYIPNRLKEGYGLNLAAIHLLHHRGAKVVITVDNGSAAIKEVAKAKELGMDLIIVDHHQVSDPEPDAYAHLNPHRLTCAYPDKKLAAVGVVFLLMAEVKKQCKNDPQLKHLPLADLPLQKYLDIVAVGTVADVAKLQGINRYFVVEGLKQINENPREGLKILIQVANIKQPVSVTEIGFGIGPRLNAGGRMKYADQSVKLLLPYHSNYKVKFAKNIDCINQKRQKIQEKIVKQAFYQAYQLSKDVPIIVVADLNWHHGIVGIVASKLLEAFNRPTIVLGGSPANEVITENFMQLDQYHQDQIDEDDEVELEAIQDDSQISELDLELEESMTPEEVATYLFKGSARSVAQVNIKSTLDGSKAYLLGYGGHVAAAGMSLAQDQFEAFKKSLYQTLNDQNYQPTPATLSIDAEIQIQDLQAHLIDFIEKMGPFGFGNPKPLLMIKNLKLTPSIIKDSHLKLYVGTFNGYKIEGMLWQQASQYDLFFNQRMDIVFTPSWYIWKNTKSIQLDIQSYRISGT